MSLTMTMNKSIVYRYVPKNEIEEYKKSGWVFECEMMGHHSQYAVIMKKVNHDYKNR